MSELDEGLRKEREKTDAYVLVVGALTQANRTLRQEKDSSKSRADEAESRMKGLQDEVVPLREKVHHLTRDNASLKTDLVKLRARIDTMIPLFEGLKEV